MSEPDVLDHTDAGDLVVRISGGERAVVANRHPALVAQPRRFDPLLRERRLILTQRYSRRIDAVVLCGMHDQSAPAAANVEHPLAGLQPELSADEVELRQLGVVQALRLGAEIGAR